MVGKSEFGLYGVVGGMTMIELLAYKMRSVRGGIAAVGCSSMGADSIGVKNYCGNLLWQPCLTLLDSGCHPRGVPSRYP